MSTVLIPKLGAVGTLVQSQTDASGATVLVGSGGTWEMVNITGQKGGVMLLNRQLVSDNAVDAVTDGWLWFKLDQQYGTAINRIVNSSEKLLTSELTLTANGTLNAGMYTDNAGWMTPKGTAFWLSRGVGNTTPSTDGITGFFNLSALTGVGGFLVVCDVYIAESAASHDDIYGASTDATNTYGYHKVTINAKQVQLITLGIGDAALTITSTTTLEPGAHQVVFFIDGVNMVTSTYVDGLPGTGTAVSKALTALPGMQHSRGVRLLARPLDGIGGSAGFFGINEPLRRVRDIKIRRIERDVSADIPELVADIYAQSHTYVPYDWGVI